MGPVASFDSCLKLVEQEVPELALIDINLEKGGSGIDVARVLLDRWRVMSIFVSSQHRQARDNMEAAIGCLDKPFATRSLVETIEVAKDLKARCHSSYFARGTGSICGRSYRRHALSADQDLRGDAPGRPGCCQSIPERTKSGDQQSSRQASSGP